MLASLGVLNELDLAKRALAELLDDLILVDVLGAILVLAQRHVSGVHQLFGDVTRAAAKLSCMAQRLRTRPATHTTRAAALGSGRTWALHQCHRLLEQELAMDPPVQVMAGREGEAAGRHRTEKSSQKRLGTGVQGAARARDSEQEGRGRAVNASARS